MSGSVTVRDAGYEALAQRLGAIVRVRVGVLSDAPKQVPPGEPAGKYSLIEVAVVHEFGAPAANIPQRSFIRATVDEHAADIKALQSKLALRVALGKLDPLMAGKQLGAYVKGLIQARIARGIAPPLAPETVARKKSSKPLIDTGQLRSSIAFEAVEESA